MQAELKKKLLIFLCCLWLMVMKTLGSTFPVALWEQIITNYKSGAQIKVMLYIIRITHIFHLWFDVYYSFSGVNADPC